MKNYVIGSRRNSKPEAMSIVPNPGHLVVLRGLLGEALAGSTFNLLAFSGHTFPALGTGTLDHSKSSVALWWVIRVYISMAYASLILFHFS